MTPTDGEQQQPRGKSRRGEHFLGVLTPPSIPRIEVPGVPVPRSRRRAARKDHAPAVIASAQAAPAPVAPAPASQAATPQHPVAPVRPARTALELRRRAGRSTRVLLAGLAVCLFAGTSPHLPVAGRWVLVAALGVLALWTLWTWTAAFRRRRAERALGHITWPGAVDLARL